ncbi:MAG: hypothetical protein ACI9GM_001008 [Salibacteraceae bacterium]|jgi:hypothetical protein
MDITLHEESYGQKSLKSELAEAFSAEGLPAQRETIKNIMAYSKALSVNQFGTLGKQETNLN